MQVVHRANSPSPSPSIDRFKNKFGTKDGAITRVAIVFPRSIIYTHQGAGKGRGGAKGSRWVDKYGRNMKTNPKSLGRMGTEGRTAKPFINDALESPGGVEALATLAAESMGDIVTENLFIK